MTNAISIAATALLVFLGDGTAFATARNAEPQIRSLQEVWTSDRLREGVEKPDPGVIRRDVSTTETPPTSCPAITAVRGGSVILKGPSAPWGVQVAGSFSFERALASFDAVQRKYPTIVAGPPLIMCSLDRSHGQVPIFQIRLPASDKEHALDLCNRLEAAGGACAVFQNGRETLAGP